MRNEFFDSLDKLLADLDLTNLIRGADTSKVGLNQFQAVWQALSDSGFLDVMTPESLGGAQLGWEQAWAVGFAAGYHGLPLPVMQTVFARAFLGYHDQSAPETPIALAAWASRRADGDLSVNTVSGGVLASHVLLQHGGAVYLLPCELASVEPIGGKGSFDAQMTWGQGDWQAAQLGQIDAVDGSVVDVSQALALGLSIQLAGCATRVLNMTLSYANDRVQFGKPIGKFQAVQQQITAMAELVYGMRMASQLGCQSEQWQAPSLHAVLAKAQTSAVAGQVASISHAVHAAIGVTQEYDLQLYTRRLYEWARAGGGAQYWAKHLGQAAKDADHLLDFVREELFQAC